MRDSYIRNHRTTSLLFLITHSVLKNVSKTRSPTPIKNDPVREAQGSARAPLLLGVVTRSFLWHLQTKVGSHCKKFLATNRMGKLPTQRSNVLRVTNKSASSRASMFHVVLGVMLGTDLYDTCSEGARPTLYPLGRVVDSRRPTTTSPKNEITSPNPKEISAAPRAGP